MRDSVSNTPNDLAVLTPASARRVSNQIGRAYRGTYGAKTGLRTIVRAIARQLLVDGLTTDVVARAFEQCVLMHPDRPGHDPLNVVTGQTYSEMLVALTRESIASVAVEHSHTS